MLIKYFYSDPNYADYFATTTMAGREQPPVQLIAFLHHGDNLARISAFQLLHRDGLMPFRIELVTGRVDGVYTELAQAIGKLLQGQVHPFPQTLDIFR